MSGKFFDEPRVDHRAAFDAAFDAADAQETRQRLEGLTKALPVARIQPQAEHAAVAAVRRLLEERDAAVAAWRAVCAERDALQARLDALADADLVSRS
jgi:hypothetical protein